MASKPVDEEKTSKAEILIKVVSIALVLLFVLAWVTPKPSDETSISGIPITYEIPLERLQQRESIAMDNATNSPAEITCKFEISAISTPDPRGYVMLIEQGTYGISVQEKKTILKGRTEQEVLTACHAFACLLKGIKCESFMQINDYLKDPKAMSIILPEDIGAKAGRGYAEIVGALSFHQTKISDLDGNGFVSQDEVDANDFFIYPFTEKDGLCTSQPYNTVLQNWSSDNKTVNCKNIRPAIVLRDSEYSEIYLEQDQIIIAGSDEQIHTGAIILRDIIAPDWIRRLYNIK